jgi:hypothetical protein
MNATNVIAIATSVYGLATLVVQIWRDRVQRDRQFHAETTTRKLNDLRSAFYEAWGYWEGHRATADRGTGDEAQAGNLDTPQGVHKLKFDTGEGMFSGFTWEKDIQR